MKSSDAIELRRGEQHRVTLSPAASGGYLWSFRVDGDAASVSVAEDMSDRAEGGGPGGHPARGESLDQQFVVQAEKPGTAVVEFEHSRSWEEAPAADSYTLQVHVPG